MSTIHKSEHERKDLEHQAHKPRSRRFAVMGPTYIPPELKEPGFMYILEGIGIQGPFQLHERIARGWKFVPASHLEKLNIELGDSSFASTFIEGDKICIPSGPGTKLYLMRIPMNEYEEICKEEEAIASGKAREVLNQVENNPHVYKHELHKENCDLT